MLAQLLNDVIDFSKIEAGRLDLSPEPMDVAAALENVAGMLRPLADAKGLELRVAISADDPWIRADPVRIRQGLFNLIGNAVKFTHRGHVEARLSMRGDAEGGRRVRFGSRTPASASPRRRRPRCSSASTRRTARPRGGSAARAWAWPSPAPWPR